MSGGKPRPAGADGEIARLRDEDAEALRVGRTLLGEGVDPAVVFVPDRLFELRDPREVASLAHLSDDHSVRQARLGGHRVHPADHHGLRLFGYEPGRAQAVGEVGRAIVPVELPLEGLAALGENLHLPRDQRVELVTVEAGEVSILDECVIAEADGSNEWAVSLDPDGSG